MYKRRIDVSWDYRNADTKEFTHGYHPYPAMMIPQIARRLLNEYKPQGSFNNVFDPYMGSGTTLVESQLLGVKSLGTDINPLARLIAQVKTTIFSIEEVENDFKLLLEWLIDEKLEIFNPSKFEHITNATFWYSEEVLTKLFHISTHIDKLVSERNKPFFKLCLVEVVREASFTRNGEFKRYKMSEESIEKFSPNPFYLFELKVKRNIRGVREMVNVSRLGEVKIDSFNTVYTMPKAIESEYFDMVVTSPPYGDSKTTVAYGQFSRWANEWLESENAKDLDNHLMGGRSKKVEVKTVSIESELKQIREIDEKRYFEVSSFLYDYEASIYNVSKSLRKGGVVCYVVGNRTVKGIQISLDYFTAEKFEENGFILNEIIVRSIPSKKMPSQNSPTNEKGKLVSTMNSEYIVILTKK